MSTASTTSLRVAWRPPSSDGGSAITDYDVRWKERFQADTEWTEIADTTASTARHTTVTGRLNPGKTYDVQVRAQNAVGNGAWSASARGTTHAVVLKDEKSLTQVDRQCSTTLTHLCVAYPTSAYVVPGPGPAVSIQLVNHTALGVVPGRPPGCGNLARESSISRARQARLQRRVEVDGAARSLTLTAPNLTDTYQVTLDAKPVAPNSNLTFFLVESGALSVRPIARGPRRRGRVCRSPAPSAHLPGRADRDGPAGASASGEITLTWVPGTESGPG